MKNKLLGLILTIVFLTGLLPANIVSANDVMLSIENIIATPQAENFIIEVTLNVENAESGKLVIAVYENHQLLGVAFKDVDVENILTVTVPEKEFYIVKAFLWESMLSIKPLVQSCEGTVYTAFFVSTVEDLQHVGKPQAGTKYENWTLDASYKQTADIDMDGEDFTAIGDFDKSFTGIYNGNEKTISNLTVGTSTIECQGLFGVIMDGIVKNVRIIDCSIAGDWYVGGIVGCNGGSMVENCYVTGIIVGNNKVGGVVGLNGAGYNGVGTVQNCYSNAKVSTFFATSGSDIGGVVGQNSGGAVKNCYAIGDVSGYYWTGGVVGENYAGTVEYCYSAGTVTGTSAAAYTGGVVGQNQEGTVRNCYSISDVTGYDVVGGVVGCNYNGEVQNCYATGDIQGDRYTIGGVVGENRDSMIQNCYSLGNIVGTSIIGGIVGNNGSTTTGGTTRNCVALNPSITATTNTAYIGRVLLKGFGTPTNNYAWEDMAVTTNGTWTPDKTLAGNDGADLTTADIKSENWWKTATNWTTDNNAFAWDFENTWEWGANNLPILQNVDGDQNHTW